VIYSTLCPSLYRDVPPTVKSLDKKNAKVAETVSEFMTSCPITEQINKDALEPLLQHYGISTTWIDVVDNAWIALWFALHTANTAGPNNKFIHFDRRELSGAESFGYIILIRTDASDKRSKKKGFILGTKTETVDLREATPSVFLRPHAQHGLLFRECGVGQRETGQASRKPDYSSHICGIIRFDLSNAISWLGEGQLHLVRSIFPPPYFDPGYQILLGARLSDRGIVCIQSVGA
jgi:hypothetical protein